MIGLTAILIGIFNGPGPSATELQWIHSTHQSTLIECSIHGVGASEARTVTTIIPLGRPGDPVIVSECTYRVQKKP